jgi:hypothetical protein
MVGPPVIVVVRGQQRSIVPAQLQVEEYRQQLTEELRAAAGHVVFDLQHLLDWSDTDRWCVVSFIAALESDYTVRIASGETTDLFDAALAAMEGNDNVARCGRGIEAAVQTAVLVHRHPHSLPAACDRIASRLTELGVRGYRRAWLLKQAERLSLSCGDSGEQADEELMSVRDVLPEAPVPEDVVVPSSWVVSVQGVMRSDAADDTVIIASPVLLTRRFTEVDSEAEHLGVAWLRDDQWHEEIVPRATIADSRAVIKLATHGAPVTSNNARELVQYLADFETYNLEVLPRARVARQLGWQGESGRHGFLWGRNLIHREVIAATSMTDDNASPGQSEIIFRGADDGDDQLAAGYREAGSYEGWAAGLQSVADYPRVKLALYASLTPPLLSILDAPNFVVSYAGATSQGKTISQRIAASVWGCPDERAASAAIGTWDATRVWIERASAAQNDLPLILDDTKRAQRTQDIAQTLYDVTSGRSRGRGSLDGIRGTTTFRTVMISSGEAPITSFSQDGGTRPRVLELWGSPFGQADARTVQIVNALNQAVLDNYGHLGPRFVAFLIDNQDQWTTWQEDYQSLRQQYERRAGNNPVAARMAASFAAIGTAANLVHRAVDMPWDYQDVVSELWTELTAEAPEADRAAVALRYVLSWAHAHRDQFWTRHALAPAGGWAGRWELDGVRNDPNEGFIAFFPHKLDEILRAGGFEPVPIQRLWHDRGWLKVEDGRRRFRVRLGGPLTPVVAIRRQAVEEVDGSLEQGGEEERHYPFRVHAEAGGA